MGIVAHVGGPALEPLQLVMLALAGGLYARRTATLSAQGRPVPGWRRACFATGIGVLALAFASPLAHVADELFLAHMAEHLLIADVGALLIVLGLTGPVLAPVLRRAGLRRLAVLGHPAVALLLWAVNLYLWHVPAIHEAAVRSVPLHAVQHGLFLALGVAMWLPLFGPLPRPAWFGNLGRLLYLVAVRLSGAVLGNVLVWAGTPLYDVYGSGRAHWGLTGAQDEAIAGGIMMVEGSLLTIGLFAWVFLRAAREGEERQELLDLAARQGLPLTEARAARAVAAGHGTALRRRLDPDA